MPESSGNRFAALVDSRGYAKLEDNKHKRRRNFFEEKTELQKYVVVKNVSNDHKSFNGVSPFLIEKGLSMITGHIKETQRLRSGDLLVLTSKEEGYQKLMSAKKLADIPIKVEEHQFLNLSKGVIYSRDLMMLKEEEITEELESQKVVKVERIKRRVGNELKDTPLHILTFDSIELPIEIKAGFLKLEVRQYFANPMRCHTCQRYGHTKAKCERVPVCSTCANFIPNGHGIIKCEPIKCANCNMEHASFDRNCPTFQMEKAIIKIKTVERVTYVKAKEIYYRQNGNTLGTIKSGPVKPLYSAILKHNNNDDNKKDDTKINYNRDNNNINKNINNINNNNDNNQSTNINNDNNVNNDNNNNNNGNHNIMERLQTIQQKKYSINNTNMNKTNEIQSETSMQIQRNATINQPSCSSARTTSTKQPIKKFSYLNPAELAIAMEGDAIEIE